MPSALNVAGEMAGASTALAGFLLVFLGLVANGFRAFEPAERRTPFAGDTKYVCGWDLGAFYSPCRRMRARLLENG